MADGAPQHPALDGKPDPKGVGAHHFGGAGVGRRRAGGRFRREQLPGAGVLRIVVDRRGRAVLDDLAVGHHIDAVRDVAHDGEVVGDQQDRHPELALQIVQQLQDPGLHRDVERGGRLVRNQQLRLVGERHGDHDPLALASRELVRPRLQTRFGVADPDQMQQLQTAGPRLRCAQPLVQHQGLGDLLLHRVQRIERGHRFLEDHRDPVSADAVEHRLRRVDQLPASISDAAVGMARMRIGQELEHGECGHRLARAGLTDQGDGLAPVDAQRGAAHRRHIATVGVKGHAEILDFQKRCPARHASAHRLARVERIAHRLADEHQHRQHDREGEESGEGEPGRLQIVLALIQQLAERRRARRQAEPQEIE